LNPLHGTDGLILSVKYFSIFRSYHFSPLTFSSGCPTSTTMVKRVYVSADIETTGIANDEAIVTMRRTVNSGRMTAETAAACEAALQQAR
jgi:hypothetical protein